MNLLVKFLVFGQCLLPLVLAANIGGGQSSSGHESVLRIDNYQSQNRLKRYALLDFKWPMNKLTYKILNYPSKFRASTHERYKVDKVIERAFESWANVSTLSFSRIKSNAGIANINIRFSSRHINNDTLAKHVPPTNETLISYIDFNNNKDWTVVESADTSLFSAALHVIGHVLGLDHSRERKAIMFPLNNGVHHLHSDDIKAIRMLYGHQRALNFSSGYGLVDDINLINNRTNHRMKRHALRGFKWPITNLTYKISNYPEKFRNEKDKLDDVIKRAFDTWAKVSTLSFRQIKSKMVRANINIKFGAGPSGWMPEGIFSESRVPESKTLNSYVHLNNKADWGLESNKTSLFSAIVHEIGHLLGLAHSEVPKAQMYFINHGLEHLHADDIAAIRLLYGIKRNHN